MFKSWPSLSCKRINKTKKHMVKSSAQNILYKISSPYSPNTWDQGGNIIAWGSIQIFWAWIFLMHIFNPLDPRPVLDYYHPIPVILMGMWILGLGTLKAFPRLLVPWICFYWSPFKAAKHAQQIQMKVVPTDKNDETKFFLCSYVCGCVYVLFHLGLIIIEKSIITTSQMRK